jgi:hypothetical protein
VIYFSISRVFNPSSATSNASIVTTQPLLAGLGFNATVLQAATILNDKFALQAATAILQAVGGIIVQLILVVTLFVFFLLALPRTRTSEITEYVETHPISGLLLAIR